MEELILENQNLIYSITKYFEKYASKEDLFQAGCIGMIMAYKKYDPNLGVKFTTYAYPYILGEMRKLVREDKAVKVSRNLQILNLKIEKASAILTQTLMRVPTFKEIANYLEIPEYLIAEALGSIKPIYSIDEPIMTDEKEMTLHEIIGDVDNKNMEDLITLKYELQKLSSFERELIKKRYQDDLTQQEIANILGMSQVQVSRKESKVLSKLKDKLTA